MIVTKPLQQLIDANAPFWAGEAEVFRSYWDWPGRSRETDLRWVLRQAYKEFQDGYVSLSDQLTAALKDGAGSGSRPKMLALAAAMHEELSHYAAFADAYEAIAPAETAPLTPAYVATHGNWPENDALCRLRAVHRSTYGDIGLRARLFTEGGYCTLFAEGMARRGRGGIDDVIATACARVYAEEFDHMLLGVTGLNDATCSGADWELLTALTIEQMQSRIRMRNAQFSYPLSDARVEALCAGQAAPLQFDYERARLVAPA